MRIRDTKWLIYLFEEEKRTESHFGEFGDIAELELSSHNRTQCGRLFRGDCVYCFVCRSGKYEAVAVRKQLAQNWCKFYCLFVTFVIDERKMNATIGWVMKLGPARTWPTNWCWRFRNGQFNWVRLCERKCKMRNDREFPWKRSVSFGFEFRKSS